MPSQMDRPGANVSAIWHQKCSKDDLFSIWNRVRQMLEGRVFDDLSDMSDTILFSQKPSNRKPMKPKNSTIPQTSKPVRICFRIRRRNVPQTNGHPRIIKRSAGDAKRLRFAHLRAWSATEHCCKPLDMCRGLSDAQ